MPVSDTTLIHALEEKGLSRATAETIADAVKRGRTPHNDPWMLAYAALLTTLLAGSIGWSAAQFNAIDNRFNAIDNRFNAIDNKFSALDDKINALDDKISEHGERLARIETLLMERLPAPK